MSNNNDKTRPIWQKESVGQLPTEHIMQFLAGDDVILDRELFLYDIQASKAHIIGLQQIDILTQAELEQLTQCMDELANEFASGSFILDERFEDCHSAIEWYLIEKLGDLGGKVHTGRSRNDQVMVALRLYMRDQLQSLAELSQDIAQRFLDKAHAHEFTPMPGYTHLQRAMPSSFGLWFAGFAEAFIDNLHMIQQTQSWLNASPLGTASGYGINLPLARELVAKELGFERLQLNPQNVQNSRGKYELQALQALSLCTLDLRRFAWDLSLFTTQEFAFIEMPDAYTTGSSIMPNKRNPDVVELLRATHSIIQAAQNELHNLTALPSNYHRDLQFTKAPLLRAFKQGLNALQLVSDLIGELKINTERAKQCISPDMFATDLAVDAVKQGKSFRSAYQTAMQDKETMRNYDLEQSIKARVSPGANGNLMLNELTARLQALSTKQD